MKKYTFILFFMITTLHGAALSETTKTILHLFYVIERLRPAVACIHNQVGLSKKCEHYCCLKLTSFFQETGSLKTEKMNTIVHRMGQNLSLRPFIGLWNQIQSFRYGLRSQEELFLLDFAKVSLVLYQLVVHYTLQERHISPPIMPEGILVAQDIEQLFQYLEQLKLSYTFEHPPSLPTVQKSSKEVKEELSHCFAFRFYISKRLEETCTLLQGFAHQNKPLFKEGLILPEMQESETRFTNSVIKTYAKLLIKKKQCAPLGQLITQFKSFDFVHDATFIKEFLILLCLIYKSLYFSVKQQGVTAARSFDILSQLSIEELLNIIDESTEKLPSFLSPPKKISPSNHTTISYSIPLLIKHEYGVDPDLFTELVFRRYYFIYRLDELVTTLASFEPTKGYRTKYPSFLTLTRPLLIVWKDFSTYHFIADQNYMDTLLTELTELTQNLLHEQLPPHVIQIFQSFLIREEKHGFMEDRVNLAISADDVLMRFYHLKRLRQTFIALHNLLRQKLLPSTFYDHIPTGLEQEVLRELMNAIRKHHSFTPLFSFWHGLRHYKYVHNNTVLKEFSHIVTLLLNATLQKLHKASFVQLIPQDLNIMTLEDVLSLLDILVEELPEFVNKTELNSDLSWEEWGKKYWLIGPLTLALFCIRIFLKNREVWRTHHEPTISSPQEIKIEQLAMSW